MNLPRFVIAALLGVLTCWPFGLVHAQSNTAPSVAPPARPKEAPLRRFSFGAGIGLAGYGGLNSGISNGGIIVGGVVTNQSGATPVGAALLEVALTRALRISLGGSGSYARRNIDSGFGNSANSNGPMNSNSFGIGLGPRWIFNPGGLVEISTLFTLGVHRSAVEVRTGSEWRPNADSESLFKIQTTDSSGVGVDGRLGIVLEYQLLERLHLRFDNQFVRAGHDWYRTHLSSTTAGEQDMGTRSSSKQLSVDFGWSPFLMLRVVL